MTTLAAYRALFVQIVARDAELMGCCLSPVGDLSGLFVMTLPALVFGKLLMLLMCEIHRFFAHLQLDYFRPGIFRFRCKQ